MSTTTPILGITEVASGQSQAEVPINNALLALENAGNASLAVAFTANAATLLAAQFSSAVCFVCGTSTGAGTLTVPLSQRLFVVDNTANTYGVTVQGATGAGVFVPAEVTVELYCDGTQVKLVAGGGTGGGGGGVTAFNTRSGAVTLASADVTTALGFVPVRSAVGTIVAGAGLAGGTISASGTISLAPIAANSILAADTAGVPTALTLGPNFTIRGGELLLDGLGTGTMTELVAGGGLDGGTITGTGTISLHGVGTATSGQVMAADGAGGAEWVIPGIPASDAQHLIGATGTLGQGTAVAIGSNLTLSGSTLSLAGVVSGTTLAAATMTGTIVNSGTLLGGVITGLSNPSAASDVANKAYVDAVAQGASPKPSATVVTPTALPTNVYSNGTAGVGATLTAIAAGALTVDSVALVAGDSVLVMQEATAANNGLYLVTAAGTGSAPYVLTRHVSMSIGADFQGGLIAVEQFGATLGNTLWMCAPATAVTVGTTAVNFTQLNSATSLNQGVGLIISANTISLAPIAGGSLMGNSGTGSAVPSDISVSTGLDLTGGVLTATGMPNIAAQSEGSPIGTALTLNAGSGIGASVAGNVLTLTAPGGGTVSEVIAGAGLDGGTITGSGTLSLGTIAAGEILVNTGSASAVPGGASVSDVLDALFGANQGAILVRGATAWSEITLGSDGQVLEAGTGSPVWVTAIPASDTSHLLSSTGTVGEAAAVAIGTGLTLASGTLSATAVVGGSATTIVAGTGLTGGTIDTSGTVAMAVSQRMRTVPFPFTGGTLISGGTVWVVMGQAGTLLSSGAQSLITVGPAATATEEIVTWHAGTVTNQGTISINTGTTVSIPNFGSVVMAAGDAVGMINQATADTRMANPSFSFPYLVT